MSQSNIKHCYIEHQDQVTCGVIFSIFYQNVSKVYIVSCGAMRMHFLTALLGLGLHMSNKNQGFHPAVI